KTESGFSIGYLEQIPEFAPNTTLMDAVLSSYEDILAQREQLAIMEKQMAYVQDHDLEILMDKYSRLSSQYEINGGFQCEMNVKKVLGGLGFEEEKFSRPISSFSGGEKTKINLACLLAREHPIMFLDEPTNHLDLDSMEWLESYLKSNNSTLLIVSHDRYFLDQVTDSTLNLENHHLKEYNGSYKSFVLQKEAEDLAQERAWEKQQQEVKELEEYINKYRAGIKSKQARGRQSRLDRMKLMEKVNKEKNIGLKIANLQSNRSGNKVLDMEKLSFSFPDKELFADINQQIFYGDNIALIGPNGAGKSTLLKIIMGKIKASKGHLIFGSQVKIGYFDQEHANLNNEKTIIDQLIDEFPLTLQEARDNLGAFLFQEDDIYKKIGNLSGGERARLSFLQLYLRKANFLILDEPTNHMDIHSREVFEEFLLAYPGTILT
ncbi:MAG: ABC-F family ATP-binding cassette domain-containing protein, partial [Clostridiales bacterium]